MDTATIDAATIDAAAMDTATIYENDGIFGYLAGDLLVNIDDNISTNPISEKLVAFADRFSLYIVKNRHSLKNCIMELMSMSIDFPEFKSVIYQAANSTLDNVNIISVGWYQEWKNLYGALRGFMLLTFEPRYTYLEILTSLAREGESKKSMNMASKFIGAYLGYNELVAQGNIISKNMEIKMKDLDYIRSKFRINTI
jgi:hypothetical protein